MTERHGEKRKHDGGFYYGVQKRTLRTLSSVVVDKVIGQGTFGVVFKARDISSGDIVALKKIIIDRTDKQKELEGFPLTVRSN